MHYSVQEVLKYFKSKKKEVKQGTVETFRSKLQDAGIISNNQPMTEEHLRVFEKIVYEKTDKDTWENLMNKFIVQDLRAYIQYEFKWTQYILLTHLTEAVRNGHYSVESMRSDPGTEDWTIMCNCIDNFTELGKVGFLYKGSTGSDVNGVILFKIHTLNNCCYYVIGKINHLTGEEDIHVFYNPFPHFEIMQCKHVAEGRCNDSLFRELWVTCANAICNKELLTKEEVVEVAVSYAYAVKPDSDGMLSSKIRQLMVENKISFSEYGIIKTEVLEALYDMEQKEK